MINKSISPELLMGYHGLFLQIIDGKMKLMG